MIHHALELVQLRLGERVESGADEAADEDVVLIGAAMGGAEQDAAAPGFGVGTSGDFRFGCSVFRAAHIRGGNRTCQPRLPHLSRCSRL